MLIEYGPWFASRRFEPGNRCGIHDMSFLPVPEDGRDEMADTVDYTPDVDADHKLPIHRRHVG